METKQLSTDNAKQQMFEKGDVARWFVFGGFWGFVFYLLSILGMLIGHRRQPVKVHVRPVLAGMGLQILSFVGFTTVFSLIQSLITRKSTSQTARDRISGGTFEASYAALGLGASLSSLIPFAMSIRNLRFGEQITGEIAFTEGGGIDWKKATGTTALLSSFTGLAVARITSWVARDSRGGGDS